MGAGQIKEAEDGFCYGGRPVKREPLGNGHINDTWCLWTVQKNGTCRRAVLQKLSRAVFPDPEAVMENVTGITEFLQKKLRETGGDAERGPLHLTPARDGRTFFVDSEGEYWRSYWFIEGARSLDRVEKPEDFYESALAFGNFQRMLSDYPAWTLRETIPGFHDTKARVAALEEAVQKDAAGRVCLALPEIQFVRERAETAGILETLRAEGKLPLRVTHNDTKLNNVLLDETTGKGLCVIDLDTVMPGLAVNDFGDSIRFGASTAEEDEQNLDRVSCSMELFEIYTQGFLKGCGQSLTETEIRMLPLGAKMMTFECGVRFLADFLEGDVYFKTSREGQNLDRCRTQFKLVKDMEEKWDTMAAIVETCRKEIIY